MKFKGLMPETLEIHKQYEAAYDMSGFFLFFRDDDGRMWAAKQTEIEFVEICEGCRMVSFMSKRGL